jgi:threonine/homoserine/homoserine lactone efflux protein
VLGLNFSLLTLAWLVAYSFAADRVSGLLSRASMRRGPDAVLGAVLVGLGVRLAGEAR